MAARDMGGGLVDQTRFHIALRCAGITDDPR
jgi:hypothetical protein